MEKIFDYPPEGWRARSKWEAGKLALEFCEAAINKGIKARLRNRPAPFKGLIESIPVEDKDLDFVLELQHGRDLKIVFHQEREGCTLQVENYWEDLKKIDRRFLLLWKDFVDQGIVFDGPYVKELIEETLPDEFFKPWEHLKNPTEEKNDHVFVWCTLDCKQAKVAKVLGVYPPTFANKLADYRKESPEAKIPKGDTRDRTKKIQEWKEYYPDASEEEKKRYTKWMSRLIAMKLAN